jgi:hypothetical protein
MCRLYYELLQYTSIFLVLNSLDFFSLSYSFFLFQFFLIAAVNELFKLQYLLGFYLPLLFLHTRQFGSIF